jgi:hypothetical protein
MRTYIDPECVVITQRVLGMEEERFNRNLLSTLQGGSKWDVAASIAVFKTAEHDSEPVNRLSGCGEAGEECLGRTV